MQLFRLLADFFYNVYHYREYLKQSIARDLRKKYKRSTLGYLWSMLNPLFMMIILTIVFSNLMSGRVENYAVFLFAGLLPWNYFDGTCSMSLGVMRANARIIDQMPVPKYIFPLSVALYNLVNLFLSLIPLVLVMVFTNHPPSWSVFAFPLLVLPLLFVGMGFGLILSVSNVFFEDTQHLLGVLLKALYFLSPILYARDMLPERLVNWLVLNPMFSIIEYSREIFYYGTFPPLQMYLASLAMCSVVLLFGLWVFNKADSKLIYFM